jgi:hypothetical protein
MEARDRLALSLDVDDLVEAVRLARLLRPWFGVAKIGIELYYAADPRPSARCAAWATRCSAISSCMTSPRRCTERRACSGPSASTSSTCTPAAAR